MKQIPKLEEALTYALGRVVLEMASLEALTRFTLRQVLGDRDEDEVYALTSELSFRKVRAVLLTVFSQRWPESDYLARLEQLMKRARRLEERRNSLFHSAWLYSDLPDAIVREKTRVTDKGGLQKQRERFAGVDAINHLADEMGHLAFDLSESWVREALVVDYQRGQRAESSGR